MNSQFVRSVPYLLVLLCISLFVLFAGRFIALPGLQYDEALFVNAALGGIDESFVYKDVGGVPVMLLPYIGALKAYIYFPIFKFFGTSVATIRFPAILISCLTIWVGFLLVKHLFDEWAAVLFAALMATDPTFVFHAKLDWGPVVLMMFLKMLALFFFFKAVHTLSVRNLWGLVIVLLLGLYDKLNFIWFVLPLVLATGMLYRHNWAAFYRRRRVQFLLLLAVCAGVFTFVFLKRIWKVSSEGFESIHFADRFQQIRALYEGTMNGRFVYELIIGSEIQTVTYVNFFFIPVLVLLLALWFKRPRRLHDRLKRSSLLFALLFGLIFLQIVITPQAGGPHHAMMLYPLHHLLTLSAAAGIVTLSGKWRTAASVFILAALAPLIASQTAVTRTYWRAFHNAQSFSYNWSPQIYELDAFLQKNQGRVRSILSLDWGFHTQLLALAAGSSRQKYVEAWTIFNDLHQKTPEEKRWAYETFFERGPAFVLLHSDAASVMANVRRNFFSLMSEVHKNPKLVRTFNSSNRNPLYEVYLVE